MDEFSIETRLELISIELDFWASELEEIRKALEKYERKLDESAKRLQA